MSAEADIASAVKTIWASKPTLQTAFPGVGIYADRKPGYRPEPSLPYCILEVTPGSNADEWDTDGTTTGGFVYRTATFHAFGDGKDDVAALMDVIHAVFKREAGNWSVDNSTWLDARPGRWELQRTDATKAGQDIYHGIVSYEIVLDRSTP